MRDRLGMMPKWSWLPGTVQRGAAQLHFGEEQLEVAAGARLLLARRVPDEITGQHRQRDIERIRERPEPPNASHDAGVDVGVGRVNETERPRLPLGPKGEADRVAAGHRSP
jgi:hypothetical protein